MFAGFIFGGVDNISGVTANLNIGLGPFSLTLLYSNAGFAALTLGAGPSALPVGGSATASVTATCSFFTLIKSFGCTPPPPRSKSSQ